MHSPVTNGRTKGPLNISDVGPRFGSTKLAAGAQHVRAFCECVGVCAIRSALTLAVLSALLLILTAARPAQAQTETVLYNFTGFPDGGFPLGGLTSDRAGNFYGTTSGGGVACGETEFGCGTVFELSPNGNGGWNETVLYSFTGGADGAEPGAPVIFDSVGNLYGTATRGGANGYGVVFELSPVGASWTETVLHSFAGGADGANPGSLIMDPAGNLYGTNSAGVFELSPSRGGWTNQVIYSVSAALGLTMDAAGNIFGFGYSSGWTVFELAPNGRGGWNATVIYLLIPASKHNDAPGAPLVLDKAGNLYGTTSGGGAKNYGTVYQLSRGKKGKWTKKILYSFKGGEHGDGSDPLTGIVFDAAANIYGATVLGGLGYGTVYELVAVGKGKYQEKVLWSFNLTDGYGPLGPLILDSAGNLYGTTVYGGSDDWGVVFEVTP